MLNDKPMTDRQLNALKRIMETDGATVKQLNYLRALNYDGDMHSLSREKPAV